VAAIVSGTMIVVDALVDDGFRACRGAVLVLPAPKDWLAVSRPGPAALQSSAGRALYARRPAQTLAQEPQL
jgi:hypothetical protein